MVPQLTTGVWVGGDVRSIHFRSIDMGQGASMALPIWAYYMQQVYADKSLGILKNDFAPSSRPLSVDLNCNGSDEEATEQTYNQEEF